MRKHGLNSRQIAGEVNAMLAYELPKVRSRAEFIDGLVEGFQRKAKAQGKSHTPEWHRERLADTGSGEGPSPEQRKLMVECWEEARRMGLSDYEICGCEYKARQAVSAAPMFPPPMGETEMGLCANNFKQLIREVATDDKARSMARIIGEKLYDSWKRAYTRD